MVIKLYKMDYSPPVRAVYMTIKALGIDVEFVEVNILKKEQFNETFLKLNPQHTIPTLEDDGKIIWDSHAINIYLITTYGKSSSLYPEDHHLRAIINQRLHFDSSIMFALVRRAVRALKHRGLKSVSNDTKEEVLEAYTFLEAFLESTDWLAGDTPTLADIQLLASVTSADVLVPIDASKFPKLTEWVKRGKSLPYYDVNEPGLNDFKELCKQLMS